MPKAARERIASPPAGTALARVPRLCLPGHVRDGRGSRLHVTVSVTNVNRAVTIYFHVIVRATPLPLLPRDSGEGGPRTCAVEGARALEEYSATQAKRRVHAPSTTLSGGPLPRSAGADESFTHPPSALR